MIKPKTLTTDHQTLTELEIFRDDNKGLTIFELLNKTITTGGMDNLKILFLNPSNSAEEIRSTQDVLKFILKDFVKWDLPFTKVLMDKVEIYYFSKVQPVITENDFSRLIEGGYYRITKKEFKGTAIDGTKATLQFVLNLKKFLSQFDRNQLPNQLVQLFAKADEIFNDKDIQMACTVEKIDSMSFLDTITIDQWFRYKHKNKVTSLIDIAYQLDVFLSMAKATRELNLSFPEIVDSEKPIFEVEGLFHLFLKKPVHNDLKFDDSKNFLFLTGPNMAGKTTFLKSCGIAIYLGQLGMGVPAIRMKLTPFNALFSSLNTTDNLSIGYSYFYSEVMRVKKAAETLQKEKKVFMIFDELFKGTNIKDAFDGSLLVINGLKKWGNSMFVLASHLTELSAKIENFPNVFFQYFESSVENGRPKFSFKICPGKSDERLGLLILQNEKIEELLNPD